MLYTVDPSDVSPQTFALFQRQRAEVRANLVHIRQLARTFEDIER